MALSTGGNAAAKRLGIPQSTITNWVRRNREGESVGGTGGTMAVKRPVSEVEAENARLRRELALLSVSRTGYLQWRRRPPSARSQSNARLDAQVAAMHAASKRSYGRPRIVRGLRELGLRVGHERVRHSLQRQALRPVYKRPYRVTTDSNHQLPVAPNILERRFDGWDINRAWVSDITYCSTVEGWLYLAVVMDLASRRIVGWSMSDRLEADLVCQALKAASWRRKPGPRLIVHSDRGSQGRFNPSSQHL